MSATVKTRWSIRSISTAAYLMPELGPRGAGDAQDEQTYASRTR
jgi:hypothetical protein